MSRQLVSAIFGTVFVILEVPSRIKLLPDMQNSSVPIIIIILLLKMIWTKLEQVAGWHSLGSTGRCAKYWECSMLDDSTEQQFYAGWGLTEFNGDKYHICNTVSSE